jgi:hypothetical protein
MDFTGVIAKIIPFLIIFTVFSVPRTRVGLKKYPVLFRAPISYDTEAGAKLMFLRTAICGPQVFYIYTQQQQKFYSEESEYL